MQQLLKDKLLAFITVNNPDLLQKLQVDYSLNAYLEDKISKAIPLILNLLAEDRPGYSIEELVMKELTAGLRPSRYQYVLGILEEKFPDDCEKLKTIGVMQYVTLNILEACQDIFDKENFSERKKEDAWIAAQVRIKIKTYLKG